MKLKLYFTLALVTVIAINAHAQKKVQNAIKVAAIIPTTGAGGCMMNTVPYAVTNKGSDRTITIKLEESFVFNNQLHQKVVTFERVAPNENRYIGCAGENKTPESYKAIVYKILMAYYDEPDSVRVRALFTEQNSVASK